MAFSMNLNLNGVKEKVEVHLRQFGLSFCKPGYAVCRSLAIDCIARSTRMLKVMPAIKYFGTFHGAF